jgi:hypothetical protein
MSTLSVAISSLRLERGTEMKLLLSGMRVLPFVRQMFQESVKSFGCDWMAALNEDLGEHLRGEWDVAQWQAATPAERGLWLTGQLWNDRHIMPDSLCTRLDLNPGSTYARGARRQRSKYQFQLLPND